MIGQAAIMRRRERSGGLSDGPLMAREAQRTQTNLLVAWARPNLIGREAEKFVLWKNCFGDLELRLNLIRRALGSLCGEGDNRLVRPMRIWGCSPRFFRRGSRALRREILNAQPK